MVNSEGDRIKNFGVAVILRIFCSDAAENIVKCIHLYIRQREFITEGRLYWLFLFF